MSRSKLRPEDTFQYFDSDETFTSIALRIGVTRRTLRGWWVAQFGEQAFVSRLERRKDPERKKRVRRIYRETNKEKIRLRKREWARKNPERHKQTRKIYIETHREERRIYNNAYYATHAENLREYAKQYRADHLEQVREKERAYYTEHPEVLLFKCALMRAKRKRLDFSITVEHVKSCIPLDGICPIVKQPFKRGKGRVSQMSMTLDRINPSLGYVLGNVAVISHLANTMKQTCTDPKVFIRLAEYVGRSV